jgi:hypothetical protein
MIEKTIKIPIFGGTLTMIICDDLEKVSKKYETTSLSNYGAVTLKNESEFKEYVVAFESLDNSLIAHEIVHIINYLFLDIGVELDRRNDETQAYLTGYLFQKIEKFLKKNKK